MSQQTDLEARGWLEEEKNALKAKLSREARARGDAEKLLEEKSAELFLANQTLSDHQSQLEKIIEERTNALSAKLRELEALQSQLQKERDKALDESAHKTLMFAKMSHEIRTPLNGVIGTLNMLSEMDLDKEQRAILSLSMSSSQMLRSVLNDAIDLAKLEQHIVSLEVAPFEIRALFKEIQDFWLAMDEPRPNSIVAFVDPAIRDGVYGDAGRLRQILNNLLSNAVKYGGRGKIDLRCDMEGQDEGRLELCFSVTDQGRTIPIEKRETLFLPYRRAAENMDHGVGSGAGLGLSICRELADLMEAKLDCEAVPDRGNRFTLRLVLDKAPMESVQTFRTLKKDGVGRTVRRLDGRLVRALIVEDVATNQLILERYLQKLGIICESAENGREALTMIRARPFDLVMMDIAMPVMDGFEATRRIKALGQGYDQIPIIGVSAHVGEEERRRMLDMGMVDSLPKPIDRVALEEMIAGLFAPNEMVSQRQDDETIQDNDEIIVQYQKDLAVAKSEAHAALSCLDRDGVLAALHKLKGLTGSFGHPAFGDVQAHHDQLQKGSNGMDVGCLAALLDRL